MDVEHFRNLVLLDTQQAEERLMNSWYPKLISMFSGDEKIVDNIPFDCADSFHECVSTLLGNQMRLLLIVQFECHPFMLNSCFSFLHNPFLYPFIYHKYVCPFIHSYIHFPLIHCIIMHPSIH